MKKIIFILVSAFMITGCGEITIDGSTEKSFNKSFKEMVENIPRKKSTELKDAVGAITLFEATKKYSVPAIEVKPAMLINSKNETIDAIDGKNADEIIKIGKEVTQILECNSIERTIPLIEENMEYIDADDKEKIKKAEADLKELNEKYEKQCF